jgi:hypothetical protein
MSYLGNQNFNGTFRSDYFSGNGSTNVFNLSYATGNENSVLVIVSGVVQAPYTYSLINGQIVFTQAPPAATGTNNIEIRYLGERVSVSPYLSADSLGIVRINSNIISENVSITFGYNASSTGPITIATGKVVTIANNSVWKIV